MFARTIVLAGFAIAAVLGSGCVGIWTGAARSGMRQSSVTFSPADVGDKLCVPGVDFTRADRQFVVATSAVCPACRSSGAWYQALSRSAASLSLPLYFLVAVEGLHAAAPAEHPGIPSAATVVTDLTAVGIARVPWVGVVDRGGTITAQWTGVVRPGEEEMVIGRLLRGDPDVATPIRSISRGDLEALRVRGLPLQVVDPRDRDEPLGLESLPEAVRIPAGELAVRAPYELDPERLVVVQCQSVSAFRCQNAIFGLRSAGFRNVAALELVAMGRSPACTSKR